MQFLNLNRRLLTVWLTSWLALTAQDKQLTPQSSVDDRIGQSVPKTTEVQNPKDYVLGPDDQISIWVADAPDISLKPINIDPGGFISLPLAGLVGAAGLTTRQLEERLDSALKSYFIHPQAAVSVVEFRSQPVSVLGAVNQPGVHQLRGRKTLVEVLSMAGGIKSDAGYTAKITRSLEWGRIPLANARDDATGQFSVASVELKAIMTAKNPEENILIRPHDVISVPPGELVYVVGEVTKAGGFVLAERETFSVLQALSMAGGLSKEAAPQNARILREAEVGAKRTELPVNVKDILSGKAKDVALTAEDILFIPSSTPKKAAARVAEAAIQMATGVIIFRR
jgi:polysaccharide export outer membrane protein